MPMGLKPYEPQRPAMYARQMSSPRRQELMQCGPKQRKKIIQVFLILEA